MKNFLIILILAGLISCRKTSPNQIMLTDKVIIISEIPISFQKTDQGGYLEVSPIQPVIACRILKFWFPLCH